MCVINEHLIGGITLFTFPSTRYRHATVSDTEYSPITCLHPPTAYSLARMCNVKQAMLVLDPMCGIGKTHHTFCTFGRLCAINFPLHTQARFPWKLPWQARAAPAIW